MGWGTNVSDTPRHGTIPVEHRGRCPLLHWQRGMHGESRPLSRGAREGYRSDEVCTRSTYSRGDCYLAYRHKGVERQYWATAIDNHKWHMWILGGPLDMLDIERVHSCREFLSMLALLVWSSADHYAAAVADGTVVSYHSAAQALSKDLDSMMVPHGPYWHDVLSQPVTLLVISYTSAN